MQEALLHYIWEQSLFDNTVYTADTGERVKILETGRHNFDGGPDFTNARVAIEGTVWAGNVEIHVKSSDWQNHGHHHNAAYDNVILHVTENTDGVCVTNSGRRIPTIRLIYDRRLEPEYNKLVNYDGLISCADSLGLLNRSILFFWFSALAIERLCSKTQLILNTLSNMQNSWEDAFYVHLARAFGLKVNSVPFEMLAKSLPLKTIAKHSDNQNQLEALMFGQAGFLDSEPADAYHSMLQGEYRFLKNKYRLKSLEVHLWKFFRLRPSNFPTIRLAEFCSLINNAKNLFSIVLECKSTCELYQIFRYRVSDYWKNHYTFGKESQQNEKFVGHQTIDSVIINVVIPFMFIYGGQKNKEELKDRAVRMLEEIRPEDNSIVRKWRAFNIEFKNAADTQAILQLSLEYCGKKKCLNCQIGNLILSKIQDEPRKL
jgi:hypothetical protein